MYLLRIIKRILFPVKHEQYTQAQYESDRRRFIEEVKKEMNEKIPDGYNKFGKRINL